MDPPRSPTPLDLKCFQIFFLHPEDILVPSDLFWAKVPILLQGHSMDLSQTVNLSCANKITPPTDKQLSLRKGLPTLISHGLVLASGLRNGRVL
jgi:hypothetical protein